MPGSGETEWYVVAAADNATATATKAASPTERHSITGILVSFSATPAAAKLLTITVAGVTIRFFITNTVYLDFSTSPLRGAAAAAVSAALAASGTGGVTGEITMFGFSR